MPVSAINLEMSNMSYDLGFQEFGSKTQASKKIVDEETTSGCKKLYKVFYGVVQMWH